MLPIIIWVLMALGVTTVAGTLMGFIIPLITVVFLIAMALIFLSKAVEFTTVSDSKVIPSILVILSLASAGYALYVINPGIFNQTVSLSMAGTAVTTSVSQGISSGKLLSITNIKETPLGVLTGGYELGYILVGLIGLGLIIKELKIKRR